MEAVPSGVFEQQPDRPISRGDQAQILQALRDQDKARRIKEAELALEESGK